MLTIIVKKKRGDCIDAVHTGTCRQDGASDG